MAAVCIDPNCKTHFRGEVVPVVVEVTSDTGSSFSVIDDTRTYCEVKTTSGESIIKLPTTVKVISDTKKQLFCSWNTDGYELGYYILRFWISINISEARDTDNKLIEDYRLSSSELNRYIKGE